MRLPRWKFGFFLLLLFALPTSVAVGDPGRSEDAQVSAQAAPIYTSPGAVVAAFTSSMLEYHEFKINRRKELDRALSCFDVPEDGPGPVQLEQLAVQFYETLLRATDVEGANLLAPEGRGTREWWISPGARVPFLRISEATAASAENWRFAPSLLGLIPEWYETWKDKPRRSGNSEQIAAGEARLSIPARIRRRLVDVLPESMLKRVFLLDNWQWLGMILLATIGAVCGRIMNFIVRRLAKRLERSERLRVDKEVLVGFERPFSLFVMAGTMLMLLPALGLDVRTDGIFELAGALFLSVTAVWSAYRLVDVGASLLEDKARHTQNRFDDILVPLVRRIAKLFITFIGIVYVASFVTQDLYGIVAGLSIGSLAVGFAAKDSIENLFGTMTVLLDKPYQLGDWITVGDIDGTVEEVGFRSTKIRTFYNSIISVPNSRFISAHIDNWGERRYRRIKTMVAVAYGTPPLKIEAMCEAIRELIRKHPYTRKDYYHIYLNRLGESSLDILVYCFVETPDWSTELREKHRLYLDILRVAEGLDVELAFPTQTLHVVQPGDGPPAEAPDSDLDARGAERMGRELADLIMKEGLAPYGGEKPPPVVID